VLVRRRSSRMRTIGGSHADRQSTPPAFFSAHHDEDAGTGAADPAVRDPWWARSSTYSQLGRPQRDSPPSRASRGFRPVRLPSAPAMVLSVFVGVLMVDGGSIRGSTRLQRGFRGPPRARNSLGGNAPSGRRRLAQPGPTSRPALARRPAPCPAVNQQGPSSMGRRVRRSRPRRWEKRHLLVFFVSPAPAVPLTASSTHRIDAKRAELTPRLLAAHRRGRKIAFGGGNPAHPKTLASADPTSAATTLLSRLSPRRKRIAFLGSSRLHPVRARGRAWRGRRLTSSKYNNPAGDACIHAGDVADRRGGVPAASPVPAGLSPPFLSGPARAGGPFVLCISPIGLAYRHVRRPGATPPEAGSLVSAPVSRYSRWLTLLAHMEDG